MQQPEFKLAGQTYTLINAVPDGPVWTIPGERGLALHFDHDRGELEIAHSPSKAPEGVGTVYVIGLHEQGLVLDTGHLLAVELTWLLVQHLMDVSFTAGEQSVGEVLRGYFRERERLQRQK